ncbi:MAG TPA: hypothetical protein PLV25_06110, partial [Opitutales bacterium]|nr:hypothetical protein [Opitutales bacterium]
MPTPDNHTQKSSVISRIAKLAEGELGHWTVQDCLDALRDPESSDTSKHLALDSLVKKYDERALSIQECYESYGVIKKALEHDAFKTSDEHLSEGLMLRQNLGRYLYLDDPVILTAFAQGTDPESIGVMITHLHQT